MTISDKQRRLILKLSKIISNPEEVSEDEFDANVEDILSNLRIILKIGNDINDNDYLPYYEDQMDGYYKDIKNKTKKLFRKLWRGVRKNERNSLK